MQRFEPDEPLDFADAFSVEFFIPIMIALLVIIVIVALVKSIMGVGIGSGRRTETESVSKSNMCGNCKLEPIYDSDSGLCRYCVKYN